MSKKNFILLSMDDDKIKKISNVISNESCRKILDYLSTKEATESELSQTLEIPISTVHYNLQQLVEAGLVSSEEFHYSQKGKEMNHYKLANKYIVIAPKKTFGLKEKLKGILPVALIVAGTAGALQLITSYISKANATVADQEALKSAAASMLAETAALEAPKTASIFQNIALWFLIGAVFALIVYFVAKFIRKDMD